MSNILRNPNTGRAIVLMPRTGSHSLAIAALASWYPEIVIPDTDHPAAAIPSDESWSEITQNCAIIVRNPIERFRSMIAHRHLDIEAQLKQPLYSPLPPREYFVKVFQFENGGLQACADWLGITVPLTHEDATIESDKPVLTPEQLARVRELYAADIALWESL
jgi:hypothetical protein